MENRLFYLAMSCALVPFIITIIQFVIFSINKEKYESLLSFYHDARFELPSLYRFYGSMGFLGSFGMSYFFSRLRKGKKVIFQPRQHVAITEHLKGMNYNLTGWIDNYYYLSLSSLFLYAVFLIISLVKAIITQF